VSTVPGAPQPTPVSDVEVRLYAAARAAADGREAERLQVATIDGLRDELARTHGPRMAQVLTSCSFLLDGVAVARGEDAPLAGVARVDVLPPFAGG
jgi:molybdopterin converting factor small subunit